MSDDKPHKLITAAKEAVKVARCDHAFIIDQPASEERLVNRFFCPKCNAHFYMPVPHIVED